MRKALLILTCVALAACQKTENTTAPAGGATKAGTVRLQGAGSTFDTPLFGKVFDAYEKAGGAQVNYQSIGSGGGVSQLTKGIVDFGASDFPLNDEQTKAAAATGGAVIHVPVTMGAVSVGYNLPIDGLKLDGQTLSDIYLGKLTKWNDPHIAALNPGVKLPDTAIAVSGNFTPAFSAAILLSFHFVIVPR